jgi:hypothetical protein
MSTLAEVLAVIERIKAARQTIVIHPDDEALVRSALLSLDPQLVHLVTIRTQEYLPRGTLFVTRTDIIEDADNWGQG